MQLALILISVVLNTGYMGDSTRLCFCLAVSGVLYWVGYISVLVSTRRLHIHLEPPCSKPVFARTGWHCLGDLAENL